MSRTELSSHGTGQFHFITNGGETITVKIIGDDEYEGRHLLGPLRT